MVIKGKKLEKVVYEEKPLCGRCGAGIVGVIPKWLNQKPLCRECAFELEQMALKPRGKMIEIEDVKAPLTPEEKNKRIFLTGLFVITILVLLFRIYAIAPLLQDPKPLRRGVTATNSLTDKCIEQMWRLSRDLQENNMQPLLPICPKSARQYIVRELTDDTIISCPTPEEHGLAQLTVSLNSPVPHALAREEQ